MKENRLCYYNTIKMLIIVLMVHIVTSTIDIDMPELKYLSDHLQPEECRRLVAALHFKSYNKPNSLDAAEDKVSEDIPCLRLLLHWNSAEGEGRGETHEMLFRRLRQIGRDDLAKWLGRTVFHELGQDLERSLENPFQEFVNENVTNETDPPLLPDTKVDPNAWQPFDTICVTIILLLSITTAVLIIRAVLRVSRQKKISKPRNRKYGHYNEIETQAIISESESEDKFDIRRKDDPALKLMGI